MKVLFTKETDPVWIAAKKIEMQSDDGCFSPSEIATFLDIDQYESSIKLQNLGERGLAAKIDNELQKPNKKDERWCLISLPITVNNEYEVLAIFGDYYLILSDASAKPFGNEPVLIHTFCFKIIDSDKPTFWQKTSEYGEINYCLSEWNKPGFFEDYHDGIEKVKDQFWKDLESYFPDTWQERKCP